MFKRLIDIELVGGGIYLTMNNHGEFAVLNFCKPYGGEGELCWRTEPGIDPCGPPHIVMEIDMEQATELIEEINAIPNEEF